MNKLALINVATMKLVKEEGRIQCLKTTWKKSHFSTCLILATFGRKIITFTKKNFIFALKIEKRDNF